MFRIFEHKTLLVLGRKNICCSIFLTRRYMSSIIAPLHSGKEKLIDVDKEHLTIGDDGFLVKTRKSDGGNCGHVYIHSVSDIMGLMKTLRQSELWKTTTPFPLKFPFGIWFRGQSKMYSLVPSVFRNGANGEIYNDERSMFNQFKLNNPDFWKTHRTNFEWLTLMQHYGIPTRLLDWTESILTATFFATMNATMVDKEPQDAILYILNALRLNQLSVREGVEGVAMPEDLSVLARAEFALVQTKTELLASRTLSANPRFVVENERSKTLYPSLFYPIAVMPKRATPRLKAQAGCFTIHSGKDYYMRKQNPEELPKETSLDELKIKRKGIVAAVKIKGSAKVSIREELAYIGTNGGTLLVELEDQARFIRNQWRFFRPGSKSRPKLDDEVSKTTNHKL